MGCASHPSPTRSGGTSGCGPSSSTGRQSRDSPWSGSEASPGCCHPSAGTASPGPAGSASSSSGLARLPPRGHKTSSTLPFGCARSLRLTRDPPIIECIGWAGCGYGELHAYKFRSNQTAHPLFSQRCPQGRADQVRIYIRPEPVPTHVQVQVKPDPIRDHARQHLPEVTGQAQARIRPELVPYAPTPLSELCLIWLQTVFVRFG